MNKASFCEEVYEIVRGIPRGRVASYKMVAEAMGTRSYRAVGQALKKNPYAPEVPCHRVVRSDGKIGGFDGEKEGKKIKKKIQMLKYEGVIIKKGIVENKFFMSKIKKIG